MTGTLIGSPTHLIIKWRPAHAAPLVGYQVYLSVISWTLLVCYVGSRILNAVEGKLGLAIALVLMLNFGYCAYARPALLSHMSQEVFLGAYPDPRKNLPRLFRREPDKPPALPSAAVPDAAPRE